MAGLCLPYLVFNKMLYKHLIILSLSYIATAIPLPPTHNGHTVQYELQLVPISPQPVGQPVQQPPYYLSAQQPQVLVPITNVEKQPGNYHTQQYAVLNRVDPHGYKTEHNSPQAVQVALQAPEQYPHPVAGHHAPQPFSEKEPYQPYLTATQQPLAFLPVQTPDPQFPVQQPPQFGVQPGQHQPSLPPAPSAYHPDATNHIFHSPPPAPHGSNSAYIATLSYGPGYPTIVYNCYIPGRHPHPTTRDGHVVKGNNGYYCIVSYHNSDSYHVINLSNSQMTETIKTPSKIFSDPEKQVSEHFVEEINE